MTNTKLRKRALLSSVAMLLVALIALGSATFAWFTANTKVNSQGLLVKTTASTGLVIVSDSAQQAGAPFSASTYFDVASGGYSSGAYVSANIGTHKFNLTPATLQATDTTDFAKFKTTNAEFPSASAAPSGATFSDAGIYTYSAATHDAVYYEDLYVKVNDGAAADATTGLGNAKVTITLAGDDTNRDAIKGAVRVALVAKNDDEHFNLLGIWAPGAAADTTGALLSADASGFVGTSSGSALELIPSGTNAWATAKTTANTPLTVTTTAKTIRVFVYLDGYDYNCYTNAVTDLDELISGINVELFKTA